MGIGLNYKSLVRYMLKDKEQLQTLKVLGKKRDISYKELVKRGIFCVPDEGELGYLLHQWEMSFEEAFNLDIEKKYLFNEGYIIPVLDSNYKIRFFVNYNWERGGARKYLNIYPRDYTGIKMYGMHNMSKALKIGVAVVVEGIFDVIRLGLEGIPSFGLMGKKLLEYPKMFLKRFDKVVYISDTDSQGYYGWLNIYKGLDNAVHYPISGLVKDVDEFAIKGGYMYKEWLKGLKKEINLGGN